MQIGRFLEPCTRLLFRNDGFLRFLRLFDCVFRVGRHVVFVVLGKHFSRFERTVRTESSEIFAIYGGARRVGRIDLHYGRFEVHGTLLLEVDLTDDELQQVIDQIGQMGTNLLNVRPQFLQARRDRKFRPRRASV